MLKIFVWLTFFSITSFSKDICDYNDGINKEHSIQKIIDEYNVSYNENNHTCQINQFGFASLLNCDRIWQEEQSIVCIDTLFGLIRIDGTTYLKDNQTILLTRRHEFSIMNPKILIRLISRKHR